jgi:glycosyltransferase involved in cell wall biosynthesis
MILFVGKDFERKGGMNLLRAFKEVRRRIKDANLVIVGSRLKASGLGITVKGFLRKEELLCLYRKASVFVMQSIYETFGHAFLEAMAYKTPCIGSRKDAMPEIIEDGKSEFTVTSLDPSKLSDRMIYLLEDENLMKKIGEEGRRKVETTFNWDQVSMNIGRICASYASEKPTRAMGADNIHGLHYFAGSLYWFSLNYLNRGNCSNGLCETR